MESSSPAPSLNPSENSKIKFIILGVVVAIVYTAPVVLFFIVVVPYAAAFVSASLGNVENLERIFPFVFGVLLLISLGIVVFIAFFSGWAAYRSANENESIGNAVIGTVISFIVGFIDAQVFSLAGVFLAGFLYAPFAASDESVIGILPVGVVVGLIINYIVAVVCGALVHYFLARRSTKKKTMLKSEGGS